MVSPNLVIFSKCPVFSCPKCPSQLLQIFGHIAHHGHLRERLLYVMLDAKPLGHQGHSMPPCIIYKVFFQLSDMSYYSPCGVVILLVLCNVSWSCPIKF